MAGGTTAVLGALVDLGAVDGDQREFDGDEAGVGDNQAQRGEKP